MFALCGEADIMDGDDLGGWLLGWYVVEDDTILGGGECKASCHAPTPMVVFQPLVARCGTTERFLFTNTNIHGLRHFHINIT